MILHGDCVEMMRTLEPDSIDAVVTDPPYGLEFMGKDWDGFGTPLGFQTWTEQWAREAYRVLKPGGHLLAFGGTRMWHRLASGIEDAGFEVRDTLMWLYGSGFPKSLDVSKAIDKRGGKTADFSTFRDAVKAAMKANNVSRAELQTALGNFMLSHYLTAGSQPAIPSWTDYKIIREVVGLGDAFDHLFASEAEREVVGQSETTKFSFAPGQDNDLSAIILDITAPATDAAKKWNGWGTALKPAVEPIVLARKPLIGTVAENVLKHGTGALNIDASRIGTDDTRSKSGPTALGKMNDDGWQAKPVITGSASGRWPANVLLDEVAAAMLDEQSGDTTSRRGGKSGTNPMRWAEDNAQRERGGHNDSGGASRFFYVAKAATAERNKGLDGLPKREVYGAKGGALDEISHSTARANIHPTVKPVELMRYLIRLVAHREAVILDPFLGSGTTAVAAIEEGVRWIGCEREDEYVEIIKARIAAAQPGLGLNLEEAP